MTSLLSWATKKFFNVPNMVASSLLKRILEMLIDSGSTVNADLFSDWSAKLTLSKVLFKHEALSSLTSFLTFHSLYISDLSFDGAYNLSKHNLKIGRCVIEVDYTPKDEKPQVPIDLTESIRSFRDQMPIKKDNTIADWLLHYVELVKVSLDKITIIGKIDPRLPTLTIELSQFDFTLNHDISSLFSGKFKELDICYGEGRDKEKIAKLKKISFFFSKRGLTLNIKSADVLADITVMKFINIILKIIEKIPKSTDHSDEQVNVYISISSFSVNSMFPFNGKGLEVSVVNNLVDVTVKELSSPLASFVDPLMVTVQIPRFEYFVPPSAVSIERIAEWETAVNNQELIKVKVIVPYVKTDLELTHLHSIIEFGLMFAAISDPISEEKDLDTMLSLSSGKSAKVPVSVSVFVQKADVVLKPLSAAIKDFGINVFIGTGVDVQVDVSAPDFIARFNDEMICQSKNNSLLSVIYRQGGPADSVDVLADGVIVNVPRKATLKVFVQFLDELTKFKPPSNHSDSKRPLMVSAKGSNLFVDFMLLALPVRIIAKVSAMAHVEVSPNEDVKVDAAADFNAYMTNIRRPISMGQLDDLVREGYAEIAVGTADTISVSVINKDVNIKIGTLKAAVGLCGDSLSLLISMYRHITFGLDEPENQHTTFTKNEVSVDEFKSKLQESIAASFMIVPENVEIVENTEESVLTEEYPEEKVELDSPTTQPTLMLEIEEANVTAILYGGSDLEKIIDFRALTKTPDYIYEQTSNANIGKDFEYLSTRDESTSLELNAVLGLSVGIFERDPKIQLRVTTDVSVLEIVDNIPDSNARLMFGFENQGSEAVRILTFDMLKKETPTCRIKVCLPDVGAFVTQEQIFFLLEFFDRTIPPFQADTIEAPLRFDYFGIEGKTLLINAHFSMILSIALEDVKMRIPTFNAYLVEDGAALGGQLAEFFFDYLSHSAFSVAAGLPVISNFRRIGRAVGDIFTSIGHGPNGFARALTVLMKTVATEVLNAGTCATSLAEKLLMYAVEALAGKQDFRRDPIASLVVEPRIGAVPNVILAPGLAVVSKTTGMLKYMKDKVNPNQRRDRKLLKH